MMLGGVGFQVGLDEAHRKAAQKQAAARAAAAPAPAPVVEQLTALTALLDRGALTPEEFQRAKQMVLGGRAGNSGTLLVVVARPAGDRRGDRRRPAPRGRGAAAARRARRRRRASCRSSATVEIEPEWILAGVLPPLLYSAAVSMPAMNFRREFAAISGLSVVLVVISALVLGAVLHARDPGARPRLGRRPRRDRQPDRRGGDVDHQAARRLQPRRGDARGREPAQRRDRAGAAAHRDRRRRPRRSRSGAWSATSRSRSSSRS